MTGPDDNDSFAVLVETYGDFDVKDVAAALAQDLRQPRADVAMRLRRNPGIPFEGLERGEAERIAGTLTRWGLPAEAIEAARIPGVPRPVRVEGAAIGSESLQLRLPGGSSIAVGWSAEDSELLAAVVLLNDDVGVAHRDDDEWEEDSSADAITELAASYKRSQSGADWHSAMRERVRAYLDQAGGIQNMRLELHADIALTTGELYRISSEAFEYRCLGAEVESSSITNMGLLMRRIDRLFSESATRSEGWLALAAGDLAEAAFSSLEAYEVWLRWRLAWEQSRRQRRGSRATEAGHG